jgi:small-conductance mechanosensitive channel
VYYVLSADYNRYMDIQQSINLKLHRRLDDNGIEFAIAPQGVIARRTPEAAAAPPDEQRPALDPARQRAN